VSQQLDEDYLEQYATTLQFLKSAEALDVWLPHPGITDGAIEFSFTKWELPREIRDSDQANTTLIARFRAAAKALGGRWEKNDPKASRLDDVYYIFTNTMQIGTLQLVLRMDRDVICERIKVGSKVVTIPAVEAAPSQSVTEDVYERECKPLFKDAERDLDAAMGELTEDPTQVQWLH